VLDVKTDYIEPFLGKVLRHGRKRLIGRLGYPHCSTAARLEQALRHSVNNLFTTEPTLQSLLALSTELTHLSGLFEKSLVSNEGGDSSVLMAILTNATRIWKGHRKDIEVILNSMSSRDMAPNIKEVLQYRLRQLAQYKLTATRLLRCARRLPLFQSVEVQSVYTKAVDLSPTLANPPVRDTGILNRYIHHSKSARSPAITSAMKDLGSNNLATLQKEIRESVIDRNTRKAYKAHAEIQLMLHYQRKTVAYPPRILKSNKDACFLCDLFVKTHGRFFVPKTHGRVYDLWMLPDVQHVELDTARGKEWARVVQEFDKAIEQLVLQVASKGKDRTGDPRESAIFSLAPSSTCTQQSFPSEHGSDRTVTGFPKKTRSSSTICDRSKPDIEEGGERPGLLPQDDSLSPLTSPTPTLPVIRRDGNRDESTVYAEIKHNTEAINGAQTVFPQNQTLELVPVVNLQLGLAQIYTFNSNHTCVRFHTRKIHIEISRSQADFLSSSPSPSCIISDMHIHVIWLSQDQALRALKEWREAVVDLREDWTTMVPKEGVLLCDSGLLIRIGDDLVQMKARVT
jgi:hypothetical protein